MTNKKFRILDLFCCEGAGADGYAQAGFDIVGVDIDKQRRYPYTFVQADWKEYLCAEWQNFDAIHASPPCQGYSRMKLFSRPTEKLIPDVYSELLKISELTREMGGNWTYPFVIENVPGSPLPDRFRLHGKMFGLSCIKERWFYSNIFIPEPAYNRQYLKTGDADLFGSKYLRTAEKKTAMGIPGERKISEHGLNQAIPPAYTRYIGNYLIHHLETVIKQNIPDHYKFYVY